MTDTMPLYRRNRGADQINPITVLNESKAPKKKSSFGWKTTLACAVVAATIVLLTQQGADLAPSTGHTVRSASESTSAVTNGSSGKDFRHELALGVILTVKFARPDGSKAEDMVSLGPHRAEISFQPGCQNARAWVRLVGDALIALPMKPEGASSWVATFSIPAEGKYRLEARWRGCDSSEPLSSFESPMDLIAMGTSNATSWLQKSMSSGSIFPAGEWLPSSKFKIDGSPSPYIWYDPTKSPDEANLLKASSSKGASLVSREGTPIPSDFRDLSNYELVCWVGSDSAAAIREAFLSVRPALFNAQRPFKFHYYKLTSFENPDQHWEEGTKKGFRKCKTILVSVDELDSPVTQANYKSQVKTFVNHLLKAFNDETFPIWMVTVNASPMTASSMCSSPAAWSGKHPCNDALFDLFEGSSFPSRVKLLDTTDLVAPQFGENQKDIITVIAMRVFTLVGHQVRDWRSANQKGIIKGLMRNGKLEPNFELIPYEWRQS